MNLDDTKNPNEVSTLEDLCIRSWLVAANRQLVGQRLDTLQSSQDTLSGILKESLGGVSSINTRTKMMKKLVDVRFLILLSKEHCNTSSPVNKVG